MVKPILAQINWPIVFGIVQVKFKAGKLLPGRFSVYLWLRREWRHPAWQTWRGTLCWKFKVMHFSIFNGRFNSLTTCFSRTYKKSYSLIKAVRGCVQINFCWCPISPWTSRGTAEAADWISSKIFLTSTKNVMVNMLKVHIISMQRHFLPTVSWILDVWGILVKKQKDGGDQATVYTRDVRFAFDSDRQRESTFNRYQDDDIII